MEMINVLNEFVVTNISPMASISCIFLFIFSLCLPFSVMRFKLFCIFTFAIVVCLFLTIFLASTSPTETAYECTIKENVSYQDFTNTFEVLEQRGQIYKVMLKEQ